jgi:zinc protease
LISHRNLLLLVMALANFPPDVASGAKPPDLDARPNFPFPIHKTTLGNGLGVISVPVDSPGIIAYCTIVRTGSRNEVEKGTLRVRPLL